MKTFSKLIFSLASVAILSSCGSLPYDRQTLVPMVEEISSISSSEIMFLAEANFAISEPSKSCADFKRGAYVQTADEVIVFEYNSDSQALEQFHSIKFDDLDYIGVHRAGIADLVNQLRFIDDRAWLTVAITKRKDIVAGSKREITPAIESLKKNGLEILEGAPVVTNNRACNFQLIIIS